MEQVPKRGMSKGCMIALIIGIVLLVIVIALGITCYLKRDAVIKWGTQSALTMVKAEVAKAPVPGVNSEHFGVIVDSFLTRIAAEPLNYEKYQLFVPVMQKIGADKQIDKDEVSQLIDAVVTYFPDLEPLRAGIMEEAPTAVEPDSAAAPAPDSAPVTQ
jgi:hypothetical protein